MIICREDIEEIKKDIRVCYPEICASFYDAKHKIIALQFAALKDYFPLLPSNK